MSTRTAPSAALEAAIEELLADGPSNGERLAEIGRLGARLVPQAGTALRHRPTLSWASAGAVA